EVADAVAYLNVVLDPLRCDPYLERIINEPKRGVGSTTLDSLRAAAVAAGTTMSALLLEGCCDGARAPLGAQGVDPASYAPAIEPGSCLAGIKLTKGSRQGVQSLRGLVCMLHGAAAGGARVEQVLGAALALSGYEAVLELQMVEGVGKKIAGNKKKDVAEDARERLSRLATLRDVAAEPGSWVSEDDMLEASGGAGEAAATSPARSAEATGRGLAGVQRFLEHAALVTGQDSDVKGDRNAVRLMTLHASKGLEFARTFIVGLEEGILPSGRSSGKPEGMAEERRLFYVGLTRAKDALYLSRCRSRFENGSVKENQPSSFLRPLKLRDA
ncbi:ATP-dependent DNA helicase UvrD1, partial [Tetrabaena socialis]